MLLFGNLPSTKIGGEHENKTKRRQINYSGRVNYFKNIVDKKRKSSFRQRPG